MTSKTPNKTTNKFSPEVRQRAVRMVLDHEGDPGDVAQAIWIAPTALDAARAILTLPLTSVRARDVTDRDTLLRIIDTALDA